MLTTNMLVREMAVRTRAPYFRAESALVQPSALRRTILEQAHRAGVGHIGSALSIVEILAALFGRVLRGEPSEPDRDRFILSKGHAALALYAALYEAGRLDHDRLERYCGDGTLLGAHPEHELAGVDFSSGSLGHGLSIGAGAALAARMQLRRAGPSCWSATRSSTRALCGRPSCSRLTTGSPT